MGRVLFTWELGGGLGHLMRARPIAERLVAAGHEVFLAARDFGRVQRVFGGSGVKYLPAPFYAGRRDQVHRQPLSFAHILHNVGFANEASLIALISAWRTLYSLVRPEAIVCDHSPTALLAARGGVGGAARIFVMGTGFCVPPDLFPMPNLRPWMSVEPTRLVADEIRVLECVNRVLRSLSEPPLHRLGQLYSDVDDSFLMTYEELDHYDTRPKPSTYRGPANGRGAGGIEPVWPAGPGKKIFAYLKRSPYLEHILACVNETGLPALLFIEGLEASVQRRFHSRLLKFETHPLDVERAAARCDVALTHGTFGTTAMMVSAGKPVLMLPLVLEQGILARKVERLRAGDFAPPAQPALIRMRLKQLLQTDDCRRGAAELARRFIMLDPVKQLTALCERIERLSF